jgi:predicted nucleic acid-binding protein
MKVCIDSNILIYSFDNSSKFNKKAIEVVESLLLDQELVLCDLTLIEFFQVITNKNKVDHPMPSENAVKIINKFLNNPSVQILYLNDVIIRESFFSIIDYKVKQYGIYDHLLAMSMKYNNISTFYTLNIADFIDYHFLKIINPF